MSTAVEVPPPGGHGDDGAAVAAALGLHPDALLDLAMTLNPVAPDPAPVLARHLGAVRRYPDTGGAVAVLAAAMGVDPDHLLLTNGGAEAIALVAQHLGGGWVEEPDFALYRRHLPRLDRALPRWASNPHNPTGALAADPEADDRPRVWDEAFYPLATGRWTRGDARRGSWVVGSLTKLLACPGLRLGYVLAPSADALAAVAARQPRWAVNGLACAALPELLDAVDLPAWSAAVAHHRARLVAVLRRHGFDPHPSAAPFVLVEAPGLRGRLAPHGVLVRDCASFGLEGVARVAVPNADGLDRLTAALDATG